MRIFISTGEVSGDLQGAMLTEALYRQARNKKINLEIVALGGDRMAQAGATILANTTGIGSVGILEALPFILPTWKIQNQTKKYLQQNPPDILILIDYVVSNLAIANYVKHNLPQVRIVYYIAPQDWAVPKLGNAPKIAQVVDKLLAIFPAEATYYRQQGIDVTWVGHPLIDRLQTSPTREQARHKLEISSQQIIITLLPASRQQEIKHMLPIIMQAAQFIQTKIPQIQFLIPVSLPIYRDAIKKEINQRNLTATILDSSRDQALDAITAADVAITKSGTVNLEIALLNVPQVVLYRVHPFTAWVARKLIKLDIPFMSPTNLVVEQEIVPELLQEEANAANITSLTLELLNNGEKRQQTLTDYQHLRSLLGESGVCDRSAQEIFRILTVGAVR